ncbi:MAG TPA: hypothetical protein VGR89_12245 [Puia sp.]|nr:hypothetical protein [Puia sp.]
MRLEHGTNGRCLALVYLDDALAFCISGVDVSERSHSAIKSLAETVVHPVDGSFYNSPPLLVAGKCLDESDQLEDWIVGINVRGLRNL